MHFISKWIAVSFICAACLLTARSAYAAADTEALAAEVSELRSLVKNLQTLVDAQQRQIDALKNNQASISSPPDPSPLARWNPDIGVVGDVVFWADSAKADTEGADRVSVRELEFLFSSAVDPYSRFDAALSISDFEDLSVEEAYLTRYDLPMGLTARVGRILPRIGKSISVHRDTLDTVDEPMVIEKYFGNHGYNKTGVDLTKQVELPWEISHALTFGVLEGGNGEGGTLFGDTRRRPTFYTHLKNYADLSESLGLELGLSHLVGSRDSDAAFEVNVLGMDATLIQRYADQRHVKLQGEAYGVHRTESHYFSEDADTGERRLEDLDDARHLWGGYLLADWRFHPQWATGFRFDAVQLIETEENFANPASFQRGYTGYLTFYQSEFARWRVQYSHIDETSGNDDDRIFVQGTFAIGEHKHKLQ